MLNKLLATTAAIVASAAIATGANLPLLTGPIPAADLLSALNQLIQSINTGVGGLINAQTAAVGTLASATQTEQTLQTYTLPASTLATAGQGIRVTCWGTTEATTATKTINLYFGASKVGTTALAGTSGQGFNWSLAYQVMRRTATTQGFDGWGFVGTANTASLITQPFPVVTDAAETLTSNIVVKCTAINGNASPASSAVVANGMVTELIK